MKELYNYSKQDILDLTNHHNRLVKSECRTDFNGMVGLLSEANTDQDLVLPYFEIGSYQTLSGSAIIFDLEWQDEC